MYKDPAVTFSIEQNFNKLGVYIPEPGKELAGKRLKIIIIHMGLI